MFNLQKIFHRRKTIFSITEQEISMSATLNEAIQKILIANRGEIACRIAKTAKKLGIKTVAIYSDADRNSVHTDLTDQAYYVGPSPSIQSYLKQHEIVSIAKRTKCQAIHPGYGFLSENMEFAQLCQKEKIIFIGPPANAIHDMGIKNISKNIMSKAGVPIIPGYHSNDQSNDILLAEAQKIGLPVIIKAVRGGGGKGMRIVNEEKLFFEALDSARTESQKSFGDSTVMLEKYVNNPRHVEVQIFADTHGNCVYLFERDCSVQRRHQKIIEEAPAPGLSPEIRKKLGEAAVKAAKAVGYVGAGTVEFIMDQKNRSFYFMEMNTRLQVEHPVTEAITGLDLVEWQLKVASGDKLPLQQEDIHMNGHAFEARIYAESPRNDFLPGAGPLLYFNPPEISEHVRVETGVRQGDEITVHYDPMIAKLVVWGSNRYEALRKLKSKLADYDIAGVDTNIEFLKDLCSHQQFQEGIVHTGFINQWKDTLFPNLQVPNHILCQATLALILLADLNCLKSAIKTAQYSFSPFNTEIGYRLNHQLQKQYLFTFGDEKNVIDVKYTDPNIYEMRINNTGSWMRVTGTLTHRENVLELRSEIENEITKCRIKKINDELHIFTTDRAWILKIPQLEYLSKLNKVSEITGAAISPIPGIIDKILVSPNTLINKGDSLIVIVAMKMEHIVKASFDGAIEEILVKVGETVSKNQLLIKIKEN